MPRCVNVWIGIEVQNVHFTQAINNDAEFQKNGYAFGDHFEDARGKVHCEVLTTSGANYPLVEAGLHPKKLEGHLNVILHRAKEDTDVNLSTHSMSVINVLSAFVREGKLCAEQVFIYTLEEDNKSIKQLSYLDSEGYLENWPVGELSI